ncbi:MAG: lamin tail domain-containing protein [Planctomycetes bacterium]|nr:lamin tail domain-containing protein [Planctomycetota bacterium]
MLAASLAFLLALLPQGDAGRPRGLEVVLVDVGQGDGAVIRAPDGTVHVVDAGPNGQGTAAVRPAIAALAPLRYGATFLSHYHSDHAGGMDEVLGALPFTAAYDRGDQNRPTGGDVTDYLNAAAARRRTALPGQVFQLGGGATLTVVAVNGQILGGAFVDPTTSAQEENSRSLALRLDYGGFQMWFGGDLTGGGNGTADVESPATLASGDVDVYRVNHHGSNTSTNVNLVSRLRPELAVFSCGAANPYGHPTTTTINRLNQAAAMRVLLATTQGTGAVGFGVGGTITLSTDGQRYRATGADGRFLDFFTDEVANRAPAAGTVVISELHRAPGAVADANGEYLELTNTGAAPVSLRNVQISSASGTFTIFTNLALYPGRPVLLHADGLRTRNGGQPLGAVWPYQALTLGNTSDTVRAALGATVLDSVAVGSGFPGGAGVAAERRDLLGPAQAANFAAAAPTFGAGDRGTPGARNAADSTPAPARLAVEATPAELVLRASALADGSRLSVVALSFGTQPGFRFLGATIPLHPDAFFVLSLQLPEFVANLPGEGYRSLTLPLPLPNPAKGMQAFAAHLVLDLVPPGAVTRVSEAAAFVFP